MRCIANMPLSGGRSAKARRTKFENAKKQAGYQSGTYDGCDDDDLHPLQYLDSGRIQSVFRRTG